MGADTPNWRDREPLPGASGAGPTGAGGGAGGAQAQQPQQKVHLSYGEFLMKGIVI